jgi:hypothetical protein
MDVRGLHMTRIDHFQLTFDWKSVNRPIPASRFDWRNWDLPDGSRIVDLRMGEDKPILIETIGQKAERELPKLVPIEHADRGPNGIGWRRVIVVANLVVFGLLFGWIVKRAITKSKAG